MAEIPERRRFKRYPIYCPVQYKADDSLPKSSSLTMNISEGGALISADKPLDIDGGMIVRILFRNTEFFIRSKVVHIQRRLESDPYSVGVEFLERPLNFAARFYDEVVAIMLYQKSYSEEGGRELSLAEASMKWYRSSPAWLP